MAIVFRSGDIITADLLMKKFDEFIKVDLSNLPKLPDRMPVGSLIYSARTDIPDGYLLSNRCQFIY